MPLLITIMRSVLLALLLPMTVALAEPIASGNAAASSASYFHKFYSGKIADKYAFTMNLKNRNGVLAGTYRYGGKLIDINLKGKIEPSGSFTMDELDMSRRTGVFTGVMTVNQIAGVWQSSDGTKKWSFVADQTSEIKIGSKKEILTKAIGDYSLESISGSGGANAMWDTWKIKGKWESNTSGISNGMRQGNRLKLTLADIRLLNSMTIKVDADLTTRFQAGGKTILPIPYRDAGMHFNIKDEHNTVIVDDLKKFSPSTTVLDDELYLLAQDGVDYSGAISGNFEATVSDIVIVSYSIIEDTFTVSFVVGECCGGSTFTFKRRHRF